MKCRKCKAELPDELHFTYCGYCGEKLQRERKKKDEIKIPTPRKRGQKWYVDLRREGVTVIEDTEAEAKAKAVAIRAGIIATEKKPEPLTLLQAIDGYINAKDIVISPSTVRGYVTIQKNAFPSFMSIDIYTISDWQAVVNAEAKRVISKGKDGEEKRVSAKTLKNEWGLLRAVLDKYNINYGKVALPKVAKREMPWLDYNQIMQFVSLIHGEKCELSALLALHSLRRSELVALRRSDIYDNKLHINGSIVANKNNEFVRKDTNKTEKSCRTIPIMIPRLTELLSEYSGSDDGLILAEHPGTHTNRINRICVENGLPKVGAHGLRRSFASLAYHLKWSERQTMLIGGWSDITTVHNIYIKLAQADIDRDVEEMKRFYS